MFYSRIYLKFQDVAATIGGLLKAMFVLGNLATFLLTEFEMYEFMINTLFYITDQEPEKENLKKEEIRKIFKFSSTFIQIVNEPPQIKKRIMDANTKPIKKNIRPLQTNPNCVNSQFNLTQNFESKLQLISIRSKRVKINKKIEEKRFTLVQIEPEIELKKKLNSTIREFKSKLNRKYKLNICSII